MEASHQALIVALGIPLLISFPVWVTRTLLTRMETHLRDQTRLLTILVERTGGDVGLLPRRHASSVDHLQG